MYNRDRRISSIISSIDDLSDIDTRAADELRAVHHENSITSFLEARSPSSEDLHDCRSPLGLESTGKRRDIETITPTSATACSQRQTMAQEALPSKAPILSAPLPRHHQRRGTVENGATSRRSRELESPPPSPIMPVFFGNSPSYKSPLTLRAADSADSVDALEGAALEAKPKE